MKYSLKYFIKDGKSDIQDDWNFAVSKCDTDLVTVTNAENIINGTDYEDDEAYRQRLLENVREEGFGTVAYYMKLGKSVTGVHDVKLVSNTDSEHSYTRKVLVNGFTKPVEDSVLLDVFTAFSDLSNIVLGHSFIVEKVVPQIVNLTFNLNVTTEISESSLLPLKSPLPLSLQKIQPP